MAPKNAAKNKVADKTEKEEITDTTVETLKPSHEVPEGLKSFKDAQREGKASQEAPDALAVEDASAQVKQVTVKCNENGSFRIGANYYALTKGKNAVLPDWVAAEFRKNRLID